MAFIIKNKDSIISLPVFTSLFFLFCLFIAGLILFSFIGYYVVHFLYDIDIFNSSFNSAQDSGTSEINQRMAMLIFQAISTSLGGFYFSTLFWLFYVERIEVCKILKKLNYNLHLSVALAVIAITLTFIPINSHLIKLNSNLDLPEFLSKIENLAKKLEKNALQNTQFLTDFQSIYEFIAGILIIGFLTGLGEELFFRRGIQKKLIDSGYSCHISIWLTSVVFSFAHFQFYSFLPRFVLSAIFGYIYHWSGNLIYPALAHITNNVFTLSMIYYYKQMGETIDLQSSSTANWYWSLLSLVFSGIIMSYIYKKFTSKQYK